MVTLNDFMLSVDMPFVMLIFNNPSVVVLNVAFMGSKNVGYEEKKAVGQPNPNPSLLIFSL